MKITPEVQATEHTMGNKASREGPQTGNAYFSHFAGAINGSEMAIVRDTGGPEKLFCNEGRHLFKKVIKLWKKRVFSALKAQRKQQIARES